MKKPVCSICGHGYIYPWGPSCGGRHSDEYENAVAASRQKIDAERPDYCAEAKQEQTITAPLIPPFVRPAYRIFPSHEAADAFWKYWKENGETHKHGFYEATWGAINAALSVAGVQYANKEKK